jgi:hypothetical protein
MAQEIVQAKESNPIINPPAINSTAVGSQNIAKVLGGIAERTASKASDYASEASKANLLQTHSMIQDVEAQSKIEIFKSPGHAQAIAKNAENSVDKIKQNAKLNRKDRLNLDTLAQNLVRSLNLTAAEKTISLTQQQAKYAALTSLNDTLQTIQRELRINPENADALIEAQYESLKGQVNSGVITAVEAANIHKQFTKQLEYAHEVMKGINKGVLTASDANAMHAAETGNVPGSNTHLPIDHQTAMNSNHYFGNLTLNDIESRFANGQDVKSSDLVSIKKISDLDKVMNYGIGAHQATGDINAATNWNELTHKLDVLTKKEKLSSVETGYKNRLKNFLTTANEPGHYQNFVMGTPEGARAYQDFIQNQTVIDSDIMFGSDEQVSLQKHIRSVDNLNELIDKNNSIGIGMHYPDYLRQPIPLQYLSPIVNSFNKDGDVASAINNIQMLHPRNRVYAMNAFPKDYRKQLTVYEVGNLAGKADYGFLETLMASQQVDSLGERPGKKDAQDKFLQLMKNKEGYSDQKLISRINPALTSINSWLSKQPDGGKVVSAKIDQALRYVKKVAADHNDFELKHVDDYIETFKSNMEKAYGIKSGFNFILDTNSVPLEEEQMQVLASHGQNEVRRKLLEYKTPAQVDSLFVNSPPIMVSSPGGRITMVDGNGFAIPDKHGHPAFNELYSEGIWRLAEQDEHTKSYGKNKYDEAFGQFLEVPGQRTYLRAPTQSLKPEIEGNINLENRPKVFNEKGDYETVKTITAEFDGKTVLLPTIINGKEVSRKKAIEHYKKSGDHLGIFKTKEQADSYDKKLHERMGWIGSSNKWSKE